eukprot:703241-Amphidinium_carterae.1
MKPPPVFTATTASSSKAQAPLKWDAWRIGVQAPPVWDSWQVRILMPASRPIVPDTGPDERNVVLLLLAVDRRSLALESP